MGECQFKTFNNKKFPGVVIVRAKSNLTFKVTFTNQLSVFHCLSLKMEKKNEKENRSSAYTLKVMRYKRAIGL